MYPTSPEIFRMLGTNSTKSSTPTYTHPPFPPLKPGLPLRPQNPPRWKNRSNSWHYHEDSYNLGVDPKSGRKRWICKLKSKFPNIQLVGGWTSPLEKFESNWKSSPNFEVKIFEVFEVSPPRQSSSLSIQILNFGVGSIHPCSWTHVPSSSELLPLEVMLGFLFQGTIYELINVYDSVVIRVDENKQAPNILGPNSTDVLTRQSSGRFHPSIGGRVSPTSSRLMWWRAPPTRVTGSSTKTRLYHVALGFS